MNNYQKLFAASSTVDNLGPYHNVKLNWLHERSESNDDYLLADLDLYELDYDEIARRDYIKRLFTEEEIGLLRDYLQKYHQLALIIEEVTLPLTTIPDVAHDLIWKIPRSEECLGIRGELPLSYNDGERYNLPFEVTYYWNAKQCTKDKQVIVECPNCNAYFGRVVLGTKLECMRCGSQTEAVINQDFSRKIGHFQRLDLLEAGFFSGKP